MIRSTLYFAGLLACFSGFAAACGKDVETSASTTTDSSSSSGVDTNPTQPSTTASSSSSGVTDPTTTSDGATSTGPGTTVGEATTSSGPDTGGSSTGGGVPTPVECGGTIYECGDALDNDGDGAIDGGDPECTSPCDDSEASFQTDLPGQNKDCLADCYWDGDSGQGNDQCVWNLKCDPENPGADINCAYDPDQNNCDADQPAQCLEVCADLTPNGCDCFGCCNVDTPDGTVQIYLGADPECSLQNLGACGSCTFQEGCNNTCNPADCELCFGQTELPRGCEEAGCEDKVSCQVDKFGNSNCPEGFFCSTGCCQPIEPG